MAAALSDNRVPASVQNPTEELWPTGAEATVADEDDRFDPLKIDPNDDEE